MTNHDMPTEACSLLVEIIGFSRLMRDFRCSTTTDEGNIVNVTFHYENAGGREICCIRWRVYANEEQSADPKLVIAQGAIVEGSPEHEAILAAAGEWRAIGDEQDELERKIESAQAAASVVEAKLWHLDFGAA